MAEERLKETKKIRRNAKAALTRRGNRLNNVIEVKRPGSDVRDASDKVEKAYNELVVKPQGAHTSSVSFHVRNIKKCMGEY